MLLLAALSCGCGEAPVTFLRVVTSFDEALGIQQLRFSVLDGSESVLAPTARPEMPAGPLTTSQAIVIVLPDEKAGRDLIVQVDGLRSPGEMPIVTGSAKARPTRAEGSKVPVALTPPLKSIEVTPSQLTLSENKSAPLMVTAQLADGSSQDVTDVVEWESSDPNVAIVAPGSIATARSAGMATLTAKLGELRSSTTLTVTEGTLTSLEMIAGTTTLHATQSVQYKVTAHFSNSTTDDYTEVCTWTSSNATVATVSDKAGSKGKVTAGTGLLGNMTTITAKFLDQSVSVAVKVTVQ